VGVAGRRGGRACSCGGRRSCGPGGSCALGRAAGHGARGPRAVRRDLSHATARKRRVRSRARERVGARPADRLFARPRRCGARRADGVRRSSERAANRRRRLPAELWVEPAELWIDCRGDGSNAGSSGGRLGSEGGGSASPPWVGEPANTVGEPAKRGGGTCERGCAPMRRRGECTDPWSAQARGRPGERTHPPRSVGSAAGQGRREPAASGASNRGPDFTASTAGRRSAGQTGARTKVSRGRRLRAGSRRA
jgi:hypothetical protein